MKFGGLTKISEDWLAKGGDAQLAKKRKIKGVNRKLQFHTFRTPSRTSSRDCCDSFQPYFSRVATDGSRARNALPRWEMAFFSAGSICADVSFSPASTARAG